MTGKREQSNGYVKPQTVRVVEEDRPLELACGKKLAPVDVVYETYGRQNEAGDNVILICHALSGDAHVAGHHGPGDRRGGWWDLMVGPGKGIDTEKYFVVCSNVIGGCSGTTGPGSVNPATGRPYGLDFPIVTIADMVKVQKLLLDRLGVKRLLSVVGGSMGGMQVLQWAVDYPDVVRSAIAIATTTHLGAQAIAFDAVGRNAILADPSFSSGRYTCEKGPDRGLGIARMIGHITYLSEQSMREKFGRQLRGSEGYRYDFDSEFAVETYLDHQGRSFVERFDANSYLYITKAMDYFDLKKDYGSVAGAFAGTESRFLICSFSSDWLFTPDQSEDMVNALVANGKDVSYCKIDSPYGHDSFLLESGKIGLFIEGFLEATRRSRQVVADPLEPADASARHEETWARRVDYELIESLIEPDSTVLDVGCGDGALLARLTVDKNIKGTGIELDQDLVLECVKRGLSVVQHDVEQGLAWADKSFDVVTLSQTVQTVKDPEKVFLELLRVGKRVIVSFPNFAHWHCRAQLIFGGKAPVTQQLPHEWHRSPNIHFLSIKDFDRFCAKLGVRVEKKIPLIKTSVSPVRFAPNLFAEQVIYVTSRGPAKGRQSN
jgi:homoserine O-acetyltransferase